MYGMLRVYHQGGEPNKAPRWEQVTASNPLASWLHARRQLVTSLSRKVERPPSRVESKS